MGIKGLKKLKLLLQKLSCPSKGFVDLQYFIIRVKQVNLGKYFD